MPRKPKSTVSTLLQLPVVYPIAAFLAAKRITVRGESMLPALLPGERVLFDTLAYRLHDPQRGDIVLAHHPARPNLTLIKRLTAVPGERTNGHLLAGNEYWLLGDAPQYSTDSRQLGPIARENILARAWYVYWPLTARRRL